MNKQIYEEAAEWLVELRTGEVDAATRERLDVWFRESPHHIRAYLELSSVWEDGGDPDLDRNNPTEVLIAHARATGNVFRLEKTESPGRAALTTRKRWFQERVLLAASIALFCLTGGVTGWLYSHSNPTYATGTGERRIVRLSDGSSLELNARSRVSVRFSPQERDVDLLEGQALFRVAKDHARPFVVLSDTTRVRAVGTQFDVYRKAAGTTVTVVEGQVAVLTDTFSNFPAKDSAGTPGAGQSGAVGPVLLSAGEQVTVVPLKAPKPIKADVATATAWMQHQLVFDATTLSDVAQEFNRYNARQLIVSDADLNDFHITGVFSSTDPSPLLKFLKAQRGISVQESDTEIRILKK
jgi:transmembrane sensor